MRIALNGHPPLLVSIRGVFIGVRYITGIYQGTYQPILQKFEIYPGIAKVLLIDVRKAIQAYPSHPNYPKVYANSLRDKEWLLLPATETVMNTGAIEYSGIMDGNCISEIVRYKRVN